jgi:DNA ligase-1
MLFNNLVKVYEKVDSTSRTLEKTAIVSEFLRGVPKEELREVIFLLQGRVYPEWDARELGLGSKLVVKAISQVSGFPTEKVEDKWRELGDLGLVAEKLIVNKVQSTLFQEELTIERVVKTLRKVIEQEGAKSIDRKIKMLSDLFSDSDEKGVKYLVRIVLGILRIGLGEGVLRDSISGAFNVGKENTEYAHNLLNDFGEVGVLAKESGDGALQEVGISIGKGIKVMLAQKVGTIAEGFEKVGETAGFEYKYDGFRLQVHKRGDSVKLLTRSLEDVTAQFPELVEGIKTCVSSGDVVLEGEAVGFNPATKRYVAFQNISQRIKRKYDIKETASKFPVELNLFDILYLDGKTLINEPFKLRRELLEGITKEEDKKVVLSKCLVTSSTDKAEKFYKAALEEGQEGLMIKNLDAPYKPGSRVGHMVKLKPVMESLDLVIVGGEWGTGKRASWLSSFELACKDGETGEFLAIGKMGTGVKEKDEEGVSFAQLTELLRDAIISTDGRIVKVRPEIVIEVAYEEIQSSPTYGSGFALRFPRLLKLRVDRDPDSVDDLNRVRSLFEGQRGRN